MLLILRTHSFLQTEQPTSVFNTSSATIGSTVRILMDGRSPRKRVARKFTSARRTRNTNVTNVTKLT